MKKILILSGGGNRLAWLAGALYALAEEVDTRWDHIAGISAGAIVGMFAAQRRARLLRDIVADFPGKRSIFRLSPRDWIRGRSLYSDMPLRRWISKHYLQYGGLYDSLTVGYTDLRTGRLHLAHEACVSDIYASAAYPGLLPPDVQGDRLRVDGGLRSAFPLEVLSLYTQHAVDVTLLYAAPEQARRFDRKYRAWHGISRAIEVMGQEIGENDLDVLRFRTDSPHRLRVIRPPHLADQGRMDFSAPTLGYLFDVGYEHARAQSTPPTPSY